MKKDGDNCFTCKFSGQCDENINNVCRRYPPTASKTGYGEFPIVYTFGWCGEYKKRDDLG